jgi:hypothetical protein
MICQWGESMKVPRFKPGTIEQAKNIYEHREVIEYNAVAGSKLDRGIALAIKHIVGEEFIKSSGDEE